MKHLNLYNWAVCWVLTLALSFSAAGQDNNAERNLISQAESYYSKGQFAEAISLLDSREFIGNDARRESQVLKIKLLLAQDEIVAAREAAKGLLISQPGYAAEFNDPQAYKDLLVSVRAELAEETIASVSKIAERPEESPATVYVISEEEIRRRGYNDLIELLKDQAGFDIINLYGATYANIYQRGYRSTNTERTLLLIDGVEENDLYFNIPYISRQYPISNIKRVEIIYGPASTMYGPNAFVGVINVVTKGAASGQNGERFNAQVGGGSYNSWHADATYAKRSRDGHGQFSITGRLFLSDEMDLSSDPAVGTDFDYRMEEILNSTKYDSSLDISLPSGLSDYTSYLENTLGLPGTHSYYEVAEKSGKTVLTLTDAGKQRARELDQLLYTQGTDGKAIDGFSNPTRNYYLRGVYQIDRLRITAQHWSRKEGISPRYRDLVIAPSENGSYWTPENYTFSVEYDQPLDQQGNWIFSTLTSYRYHVLNGDNSGLLFASNYWRGNLKMANLVNEDTAYWVHRRYFEEARQLRTEAKFVYAPNENYSIVSGIEVRNSQLQGDYLISYDTVNVNDETDCAFWPRPQGCGTFDELLTEGGNQFGMWDVGIYSQAQWHIDSGWKLVGGARLDYNRIRTSEGFGWAINPRVALVYTPRKGTWIVRGVYASGLQNPSQWSKYSTGSTRVPNPTIHEENIHNFEGSLRYNLKNKRREPTGFLDLSVYFSQIENVVGLAQNPNNASQTQNTNIGTYRILGAQLNSQIRLSDNTQLWGNYSFTNGFIHELRSDINVSDKVQVDDAIADIARHQVKVGVNQKIPAIDLNVNVRGQYISPRRTGPGTTNPTHAETYPAYFLLYSTLTYDASDWLPGLRIQAALQNLTNTQYYHPGPLNGDGITNPARIPQRNFNAMFQIIYDL